MQQSSLQRKLKYLASINDDALGEDTDADFEMSYIDIGNVDSSGRISEFASYRFENAPSRARRLVRDGDVVISTVRTYLQAITQIHDPPDNLVVSTGFAVVRPLEDRFDAGYCRFALREPAFLAEVEKRSVGVNYPAINATDLADIPIPVHPLPKQRAIADYLERETARLDALVAEKERLLKLLTEKRRALITRAVTRGLDLNASMRDSGIPWLGEIPSHWNLAPLRFLVSFVGGATPDTGKEKYWSGDIPWVSPKDMKYDEIDGSEDHVTELAVFDTSLRMIPPDSVLVVVRGMILAHSFPAAITKVAVTVNQDMKALLCHEKLDPWFLRDFFRGIEYHLIMLVDSSAHGTRKLETERIGQIPIPLPPRVEQQQITRYILDSTNRIDKTRTTTERTIALLKERRAALIAAAVTGQIDVEYAK